MVRKNLKVSESTFTELEDEKREGETWDECFGRLLSYTHPETVKVDRDQLKSLVGDVESAVERQVDALKQGMH